MYLGLLCPNGYNWRTQSYPYPQLPLTKCSVEERNIMTLRQYQTLPSMPICKLTSFGFSESYLPNYAVSTLKSRVMSLSLFVGILSIVLVSINHYLEGSPVSPQNYSIIYTYIVRLPTNHDKSK